MSSSEDVSLTTLLSKYLKSTKTIVYFAPKCYHPEMCGNTASAINLAAPNKRYASRAHALAEVDKQPFPPVKGVMKRLPPGGSLIISHEQGTKFFAGKEAISRLKFINPRRLGAEHTAVYSAVGVSSYLYMISLSQLCRFARGNCARFGKCSDKYLRKLFLQDSEVRIFDSNLDVYQRFFEGIDVFFTEISMLIKWFMTFDEELAAQTNNVFKFALTQTIKSGSFDNDTVNWLKTQLESIHKQDMSGPFAHWLVSKPLHVQISLYRLRRGIYKQEPDRETLLNMLLKRRTLEPIPPSSIKDRVLGYWHKAVNVHLEHRSPPQTGQTPRLNKSSASILFTRAQGGGSAEVQFFIGLSRLAKGQPSRLSNVFGDMGKPTLQEFRRIVELQSEAVYKNEYREAADYLFTLIEQGAIPIYSLVQVIYPEREPKSRSFVLELALLEIFIRPVIDIAKGILSSFPETESCFGGSKSIHTVLDVEGQLFDSDSQFATDYFPVSLPKDFYQPITDWINDDLVSRAMNILCSVRTVGAGLKRPNLDCLVKGDELIGANRFLNLEIAPPTPPSYLKNSRTVFRESEKVSVLKIYAHRERILEKFRNGQRFILKAPTGTGKTIFLASLGRVVISLPTVSQIQILGLSLEHFGIEFHLLHAGLDRPSADFEGTIVCTPAYVSGLMKKRSGWIFVNDEGDTPFEEIQLNHLRSEKENWLSVCCTATPQALRLSWEVVEIKESRPFQTFIMKEIKGETLLASAVANLFEDLAGEEHLKVMIVGYSEPHCLRLSTKLSRLTHLDVVPLLGGNTAEECKNLLKQPLLICMNSFRAGITIDGLTHVYDLGLRYQFVTDECTGLYTGVLCRVSDSDRKQLQGRVGRVSDGYYTPVSINREASESVNYITNTSNIVDELFLRKGVNIYDLPRDASLSSLKKEILDRAFVSIALDRDIDSNLFVRNRVWKLFLQRTRLTPESRAKLLLFHSCYTYGLPQKWRELTRIDDPVRAQIGVDYEEMLERGQPLLACFNACKACELEGVLPFQIGLVKRDSGNDLSCQNDYEKIDLNSRFEIRAYVSMHWQQWCQKIDDLTAVGYVRTFSVNAPESLKAGDFFCPIGLHFNRKTSALSYSSIYPVDWIDMSKLSEMVRARLSKTIRIGDWPETKVKVKGKDTNSSVMIVKIPPLERRVFKPHELPKILEGINNAISSVCIQEVDITSGVNMGSELSFPVLNGIAWGCAKELYRLSPTTRMAVYGDDVIGKGPTNIVIPKNESDYPFSEITPLDLISFIRSKFGMKKKESASGTQTDRLTVFCERFFSNDGEEHDGIKPHSFLRLYQALRPQRSLLPGESFPEDFIDIVQKTKLLFPSFLLANSFNLQGRSRRRRTTSTRAFISEVIRSTTDVKSVVNVAPESLVLETIKEAESKLFMVCPPTRGQPYEKLQQNNRQEPITIGQVMSVRCCLEGLN